MKKKNILVLGSQGGLGRCTIGLYSAMPEFQVHEWGRKELDVTKRADVHAKITALKPDIIINCTAYNDVDGAEKNQYIADEINGSAVGYIAEAAHDSEAILVHYSTNYVFKGDKLKGYDEGSAPDAVSAYGKSKILGEINMRMHTGRFYLIRIPWLYNLPSANGKKSFIEKMLAASEKGELSCIGDEFAQPTSGIDVARATKDLIESKSYFGIYHFPNEQIASWYDWAEEIFRLKGIKIHMKRVSRNDFIRVAARPQYGCLSNTKRPPLRSWREALKEFLNG